MNDDARVNELAGLRADIDALDAAIIDLVGKRQATSTAIQERRRSLGGGPVDPAREDHVRAGYVAALGEPGSGLATAVLDCCRPASTPS